MVQVVDAVLRDIGEYIATHAPERGGVLYGPPGYDLITNFEYDSDAETTSVTYVPSANIVQRVADVEEKSDLKFKGVIHSHPEGYSVLSSGDEIAACELLTANPHLSTFYMPIVHKQTHDNLSTQQATTWYKVLRKSNNQTPAAGKFWTKKDSHAGIIQCNSIRVVPILSSIESLAGILNQLTGIEVTPSSSVTLVNYCGAFFVATTATSEKFEIVFMVSCDYPITAPITMCGVGDKTRLVNVTWNALDDIKPSLHLLAEKIIQEISTLNGEVNHGS